jgi:hypothetical protein
MVFYFIFILFYFILFTSWFPLLYLGGQGPYIIRETRGEKYAFKWAFRTFPFCSVYPGEMICTEPKCILSRFLMKDQQDRPGVLEALFHKVTSHGT